MKSIATLLLIISSFLFFNTLKCQNENIKEVNSLYIKGLIENNNKLVIFFWATWCKPCIEALEESFHIFPILEKNDFNIIFLANIKSSPSLIHKFFENYPNYINQNYILKSDKYFPNNRMKTLDKIREDICPKCNTVDFKNYKALQMTSFMIFIDGQIVYNNTEYYNKNKVIEFLEKNFKISIENHN